VGEEADLASHWLGLRLQIGLQKMLPLPYPAPTGQLFALSKRMPAAAVEELELLAGFFLSNSHLKTLYCTRQPYPSMILATLRRLHGAVLCAKGHLKPMTIIT
jgi:hypothetical protein